MVFLAKTSSSNKNAASLESPEVDPSEAALAISVWLLQQKSEPSGSYINDEFDSLTVRHLDRVTVDRIPSATLLVVSDFQLFCGRPPSDASGFLEIIVGRERLARNFFLSWSRQQPGGCWTNPAALS